VIGPGRRQRRNAALPDLSAATTPRAGVGPAGIKDKRGLDLRGDAAAAGRREHPLEGRIAADLTPTTCADNTIILDEEIGEIILKALASQTGDGSPGPLCLLNSFRL